MVAWSPATHHVKPPQNLSHGARPDSHTDDPIVKRLNIWRLSSPPSRYAVLIVASIGKNDSSIAVYQNEGFPLRNTDNTYLFGTRYR